MLTVMPGILDDMTARAMAALDEQVAAAHDPELSALVAAARPQIEQKLRARSARQLAQGVFAMMNDEDDEDGVAQ